MCGIIHVKRRDGKLANRLVLKRFEKQSSRGTEGFGYVEINNGIVGAEVRTQTEKAMKLKIAESKATEILFHHRTPTSTPNFVEATHPIYVSHKMLKYDYYVVHNGIISNDDELKKQHALKGFQYTTEIIKKWITKGKTYKLEMYNDSEALAIDFCLSIEQGLEMKAQGSIALVALQFTKKTRKAINLYFCRNIGNPLKIEQARDFMAISSESGKEIRNNILFRYNYATDVITEEDYRVGTYASSYERYAGYGGYDACGNWRGSDRTTGISYGIQDYDVDEMGMPTPFKNSHKNDDSEEGDFDMELWDEKTQLEDDMRKAEALGDYEKMVEIDVRLMEIDKELNEADGIEDEELEVVEEKGEVMEGDIEKLGVGYHLKKSRETQKTIGF